MVQLLSSFPKYVVAYRAQGQINDDEYQHIVMTRVKEVAEQFGAINFLVLLETDIGNYKFEAFLNYLKVSFEHFSKWNRMAIVSDQGWVRVAYRVLSPLVHGEIKAYEIKDFETAKAWVSSPLD